MEPHTYKTHVVNRGLTTAINFNLLVVTIKEGYVLRRISLIVLAVFLMSAVIFGLTVPAFAAASTDSAEGIPNLKVLPTSLRMSSLSVLSVPSPSNEFVSINVGGDGRFNFGLKPASSDWYNISYSWPSSPWSSFTTVRVDGQNQIFGANGFIEPPHNIDSMMANQAIARINGVTVRQELQVAGNPATGLPDAARICYVMTNTDAVPHQVGLRIMIDTMLQYNDGAPFRVPGSAGMESVVTERDYLGPNVPEFWQAFYDLNDPQVAAQYTLRGGDSTPPDRLVIADWGDISGTDWGYTTTDGKSVTSDSATGMWWDPVELAPGETRTVVTYYGQPRVNYQTGLTLSCPSRVPYSEWSQGPFNLVAYLNNNSGNLFENSFLVFNAPVGLEPFDGDNPTHGVGNVPSGSSGQTNWLLKASAPGSYLINVCAYASVNGQIDKVAEAQSWVEILPPPVPSNVNLIGTVGTGSDGTPTASRTSPLTVQAGFDPQPAGVTLTASDGGGYSYSAEMQFDGSLWTHTFYPGGQSPLTINLVPRYEDGSTGPAEEFSINLIDPSGFVYNAAMGEDWRLPGAHVTLWYHDPEIGAWVIMDDAAYPGRMMPVDNPMMSDEEGRYGWDVAEGEYKVVVTRPGFEAAESRSVFVPPAVTDLNIAMNPIDSTPPVPAAGGVDDGRAYHGPVTLTLTANDDSSGVRSILYSVNGGGEITVNGDNVAAVFSSAGSYVISYRAVDYAGNESVANTISFSIDPDAPEVSVSGVTDGSSYTAPVTALITAVDNGSGMDFVAYSVDGGSEVVVTGSQASVNVSAVGNHVIQYRAVDQAGNERTGSVSFTINAAAGKLFTWSMPSEVRAGEVLPISFTWTENGAGILDKSVTIRVRNADTGRLYAGYVYGSGITYDPATGQYRQEVDTAKYGVQAGTRLRIMVYFGGKLKESVIVNVVS